MGRVWLGGEDGDDGEAEAERASEEGGGEDLVTAGVGDQDEPPGLGLHDLLEQVLELPGLVSAVFGVTEVVALHPEGGVGGAKARERLDG